MRESLPNDGCLLQIRGWTRLGGLPSLNPAAAHRREGPPSRLPRQANAGSLASLAAMSEGRAFRFGPPLRGRQAESIDGQRHPSNQHRSPSRDPAIKRDQWAAPPQVRRRRRARLRLPRLDRQASCSGRQTVRPIRRVATATRVSHSLPRRIRKQIPNE